MESLFKEIESVLEGSDWTLQHYSEGSIDFSTYSPAGRDFSFQIHLDDIEDLSDVYREVESYWDGFDISSETYIWLDQDGHGANGAPHDMRDLYNDTEALDAMIQDLYQLLRDNS